MTKSLDEDGFVWQPGSEQRSLARLRFDPEQGIDIVLLNADWSVGEDVGYWPTLHGESLWGTPWTLFEVRRSRYAGAGGHTGNSRTECDASTLFVGVHAKSEDDVELGLLQVRLRGLREWLTATRPARPSPLARPETADESLHGMLWTTVGDTELDFTVVAPSASGRRGALPSELMASVQVHAQEPLSLSQWLDRWLVPLRNLLVFATREQSVIESLRGVDADGNDVVVYETWRPMVQERPSAFHQRDLLPAAAVGDVGEFLRRWLALHEELGAATQFLFGTLNDRDLPAVNRLLNMLAFAETYHRSKHDEPPLSVDEDAAFRKAMLSQLPTNARRTSIATGSSTPTRRASANAHAGSSGEPRPSTLGSTTPDARLRSHSSRPGTT